MKENRIIGSLLSLTVLFSANALAGCGRREDRKVVEIDATRTQLNIGIVDGGLSYLWLNDIISEFEKEYAEISFENGKKGVQVRVFPEEKYKANTTNFELNLSGYDADVIFTEGSNYYSLASKGLLLDITDVVTTSLQNDFITGSINTSMDDESIEEKMTDEYSDFYKIDGCYYGLPYYISQSGIVYDVDLFEENNLYFAAEGAEHRDADGFVTDGYTQAELSCGPDGRAGTRDDGLPATYDDFFKLCDQIAYVYGFYPIIWTGKVQSYATGLMYNLWADYEGKDNMRLNFDFEGTATDLIQSFDTNGRPVYKASTRISAENGYEMYSQAGRYYAIDFMQRLISDSNYYNEDICFSPSTSHLKAQDEFLYSTFTYEGSAKTPVAMLIEGTWWENEANNTFNAMVDKSKDEKWSKYNRRFSFMPFPKATSEKIGEVNTTLGSETLLFANANIKDKEYKVKLAKAFIQYCHTNQALETFALSTNSIRPYKQSLSEDSLSKMTYFGRSLYEDWITSDQVFAASKSNVYRLSPSTFSVLAANGFTTQETNTPTSYFYKNKSYTAIQFFNDVVSYNDKAKWDSVFSSLY